MYVQEDASADDRAVSPVVHAESVTGVRHFDGAAVEAEFSRADVCKAVDLGVRLRVEAVDDVFEFVPSSFYDPVLHGISAEHGCVERRHRLAETERASLGDRGCRPTTRVGADPGQRAIGLRKQAPRMPDPEFAERGKLIVRNRGCAHRVTRVRTAWML
ncbi:hypothetical protein [Rhodococcus sp. Eu-32]|uniref:hypothetical protein n=1 Tax=Rhodococcus sp. Eu-32 TaxID=1017319 RepID=UPI001FB43F1B|nr:hypothetical protein [Rhodococcus sp. Eu-32]